MMSIKSVAMRDALLDNIWKAMAVNPSIFFLSADFGSPVLDKIRSDFPSRFVNVGIAEQNLINISAGLALEGYTVFAYAIAPFITMRCFEQIRVNLALLSEVRKMNVNLIGVGAGYSYVVSGPTHQCYEDITVMRALPNFAVLSPSDHVSAAKLIDKCLSSAGLRYLRLDAQVLPVLYANGPPKLNSGFHIHNAEGEVCLVATGYMVHTALQVRENLQKLDYQLAVMDLFDLSTFNKTELNDTLSKFKGIVTLEEGFRGRGGMDAMLLDFLANTHSSIRLLNLGVEGTYRFEIGTRIDLHEQVGIGPTIVQQKVLEFIDSFKQ
jgi:transketolase